MRIILFLFILLSVKLSGQESYMRWRDATDHYLGVFLADADVKKEVWVRDTFAFVNTSNQDMVIQKAHVRNPEFFSFTKTIKPGETGYIYYAERINPYSEAIDTVEYRAVFPTNFSPWSMVTIHYFVVRKSTERKYNAQGKLQSAVYNNPNASEYLELNLYPNGKPKSFGWKSKSTNQEVLLWRYYSAMGMPERDSLFSKQYDFVLHELSSSYPVKCEIEVREKGEWKTPEFSYANYAFRVFLKAGVDSIHFYTDSSECFFVVNYKFLNIKTANNLTLVPDDWDYFYNNSMQVPILYDDDRFAISWKMDDYKNPHFPNVEDRLDILQQQYPDVDFEWLHENYYQHLMVVNRNLSQQDFRQLQENLLKEDYVDQLSQVFYMHYNGVPSCFTNPVIVKFRYYPKPAELDSLASRYGFKKFGNEQYNAMYYFEYQNRIMDRSSLLDFNGLSGDAAFENVGISPLQFNQVAVDEGIRIK